MLRPIKDGSKLIGYYETERGVLGHVIWYYLDGEGKRCMGGGAHSVADAKKSAKRRAAALKQLDARITGAAEAVG